MFRRCATSSNFPEEVRENLSTLVQGVRGCERRKEEKGERVSEEFVDGTERG